MAAAKEKVNGDVDFPAALTKEQGQTPFKGDVDAMKHYAEALDFLTRGADWHHEKAAQLGAEHYRRLVAKFSIGVAQWQAEINLMTLAATQASLVATKASALEASELFANFESDDRVNH